MQIVVRQISGLGNQLFQYAAGRYYANRYGATLRIAVDPAWRAISHGSPRPFLLQHFRIPTALQEMTRLDRLVLSERPALEVAAQVVRKTLGIEIVRESAEQRYTFLPELPIDRSARTIYLAGYWQTYRIPEAIETELRRDLQFRAPAEGATLSMLRQIEGSEAVSLHIRRGDYTLAAEGNIALPMEYYERGIDMFRERLAQPTFYVFSDDLEFARNNLPRDARLVFVGHNDSAAAHEDLRLMSCCRHHIIANSTFSWWGAWLNPRPDKVVLAPRNWHARAGSFFPGLLPPQWILDDEIGATRSARQVT